MLRKWVSLLILVAVLGAAPPAQAQDTIYGIITGTAEVRVGPDFGYAVIGRLPANASVVVMGRAGDFFRTWDGRQWLQIDYTGTRNAWVYARLVRTSVAFNAIPPTGRLLPRDADGRVPEIFDLTTNLCEQWAGDFTRSGDFGAGDSELVVTYPALPGTSVYSVIAIAPSGQRTAFDSETTTAIIELDRLPWEGGEYTWRVVPYYATSTWRYTWQQICLLRTGGTFFKPDTTPQR